MQSIAQVISESEGNSNTVSAISLTQPQRRKTFALVYWGCQQDCQPSSRDDEEIWSEIDRPGGGQDNSSYLVVSIGGVPSFLESRVHDRKPPNRRRRQGALEW